MGRRFALCYKPVSEYKTFETETDRKKFMTTEIHKINNSSEEHFLNPNSKNNFFRSRGVPGLIIKRYDFYPEYKGKDSLYFIDRYILERYNSVKTKEDYDTLIEELNKLVLIEYRNKEFHRHSLINLSYKEYFNFDFLVNKIVELLLNRVIQIDDEIFYNEEELNLNRILEAITKAYESYLTYRDMAQKQELSNLISKLLKVRHLTEKGEVRKYYQLRKTVFEIKDLCDKNIDLSNPLGQEQLKIS